LVSEILPIGSTLVFPALHGEIAPADTALAQAKFLAIASQFFFTNFSGCLQRTTQCQPPSRVFYCEPFKGKPGASRGRKASGL
jgi:hypothetical protein